jgi:hypothetical protein
MEADFFKQPFTEAGIEVVVHMVMRWVSQIKSTMNSKRRYKATDARQVYRCN